MCVHFSDLSYYFSLIRDLCYQNAYFKDMYSYVTPFKILLPVREVESATDSDIIGRVGRKDKQWK